MNNLAKINLWHDESSGNKFTMRRICHTKNLLKINLLDTLIYLYCTNCGSIDDEDSGSIDDEDAGSIDDEDAGSIDDEDAGSIDDEDAGSIDDEDAGSIDDEDAGSDIQSGNISQYIKYVQTINANIFVC